MEFEADALGLLEDGDDFEQGAGARVAGWAERRNIRIRVFGERWVRSPGTFAECDEADGGVDGVAQDGFAHSDFASDEASEAFSEEGLREFRIGFGADEDGFPKFFCQ